LTQQNLVRFSREDGVAILTLDNPPLNLLTLGLLNQLKEYLSQAGEDDAVKGVVIVGAGNYAFSAGADLREIASKGVEGALEIIRMGHSVFNSIEDLPKPVVAAINGLCLGGGLELALACDMRVCSERARFQAPEVTIGLIPAWGGTQRLARLVGSAKAKEMIFTGMQISAQEASRIGLVNRVVPDGEELRAAADIVRLIGVRSAPLAVRAAKRAINLGLQRSTREEALEVEAEALLSIASSEDLREGIQALLEKRPPNFKGR
jgi:enoyl-CoA hydratase/carnithine racemase